MVKFPKPLKKSVIYEDKKLYACLATHPISKGHAIVVWKKDVPDHPDQHHYAKKLKTK